MHTLLQRQIKRYLGDAAITPELQQLFAVVSISYEQADMGRTMLERSLELTSLELRSAHSSMRAVFEQLVRSSSDGIFAFDHDYRFTVWNPEMEHISGFRNVQVIGKSALAIFPALAGSDDHERFSSALAGRWMLRKSSPGSSTFL